MHCVERTPEVLGASAADELATSSTFRREQVRFRNRACTSVLYARTENTAASSDPPIGPSGTNEASTHIGKSVSDIDPILSWAKALPLQMHCDLERSLHVAAWRHAIQMKKKKQRVSVKVQLKKKPRLSVAVHCVEPMIYLCTSVRRTVKFVWR